MAVSGQAAARDWAAEAERIAFIYARWKIGKRVAGPGWVAWCTFWDGATISIEAPDLVILETRLRDHREQERRARAVKRGRGGLAGG